MKTDFVTRQPIFLETLQLIKYAVQETFSPILVIGPIGSGRCTIIKKFLSEEIPFFEIRCTDNSEFGNAIQSLCESRKRIIFLREIDAATSEMQAKILTILDSDSPVRILASMTEKSAEEKLILRPDLQSVLSTWTFRIPALAQRPEDFPELIEQEIALWSKRTGKKVSFSDDALKKFLLFSSSPEAVWTCNFRDLRASITRMASLAFYRESNGIISQDIVAEEIIRLKSQWAGTPPVVRVPMNIGEKAQIFAQRVLGRERWNSLDRFDRSQLADVLWVCRQSQNFSEAGRILFSSSRLEKKTFNDSDRMRKYLLKFGISWNDIQEHKSTEAIQE